ncbi:MAG TPA: right-handed parallel beta-helix repeat-containing protein [Planctomycetaceae bacterium]|nr:right-handed parallel beta-helix repeat-containing protein [Planctomycetaceae bacterium]
MPRRSVRRIVCLLGLVTVALPDSPRLHAAILYVDNRQGRDVYDGRSERPIDVASGPLRTIGRALRLAGPGDAIVVANTGVPYTGPVALAGPRNSGFESLPLTIVGNGAVVDGSQAIDRSAWRPVRSRGERRTGAGEDPAERDEANGPVAPTRLWAMTPWRKGTYLLLNGDAPLPEHPRPRNLDGLAALPAGHWTALGGSIYLRLPALEEPGDHPLRLAWEPMGLSLYKVRHVLIRDLTFQHFQVDGVNLHDLCEDVVLDNVRSLQNARAGVTVAGTSSVILRNCELRGNGRHSLLVTEKAGAEVDAASQLSTPPTVAE